MVNRIRIIRIENKFFVLLFLFLLYCYCFCNDSCLLSTTTIARVTVVAAAAVAENDNENDDNNNNNNNVDSIINDSFNFEELIHHDDELLFAQDVQPPPLQQPADTAALEEEEEDGDILMLDDDSDGANDNDDSKTNHNRTNKMSNGTDSIDTTTTTATLSNSSSTNNNRNSTKEPPQKEVEPQQSTIHIQSNLELLSNDELIAICTERGFDITTTTTTEGGEIPTEGNNNNNRSSLTHDDYVLAATECLSLEHETNAILAENPDLAADLDQEVERIRRTKERLEQEQFNIQQDIQTIEDQLRQSGIDPSTIASSSSSSSSLTSPPNSSKVASTTTAPTTPSTTSSKKHLNELTADEVLRESFVQLFDRVGADLQLVFRTMQYVLDQIQPVVQPTITMMYKYVISPILMDGILRPFIKYSKQQLKIQQPKIRSIMESIVVPRPVHQIYDTILRWNGLIQPLRKQWNGTDITRIVNAVTVQIQQICYTNQPSQVQLVFRMIGAFVIPLYESVSMGVTTWIVPSMRNGINRTMSVVLALWNSTNDDNDDDDTRTSIVNDVQLQ